MCTRNIACLAPLDMVFFSCICIQVKNIYVDASLFLIYIGTRRGSPSRAIPNYLMESNNRTAKLDPHHIPTPEGAMRQ